MIQPVLKNVVLDWEPDAIDDFVIPAEADIGIEGEKGIEFFDFTIITPKRLKKILEENRVIDGRAIFIVNEPTMEANLELVKRKINEILQDCVRETWDEVAKAINRHLQWEYDNCDNIQYTPLEEALKRLKEEEENS